jgi:integrase
MASFEFDRARGRARLFFRFDGRQYNKTLKVASDREAERLCALIEETVQDIERGKLALPPGADVKAFVLSGGKLTGRPKAGPSAGDLTLGGMLDRYEADPPPHLEGSTRKMQAIHGRRLREILPADTPLLSLDRAAVQGYIGRRSKQRTFRGPIVRETILKELKTLRQVWAWVHSRDPAVPPPAFALKDLAFPKAGQPHPFMSWQEIEREIRRGRPDKAGAKKLWDCLWLDTSEVAACLEHVRSHAAHPFAYPLFCFAAYTGARRSELCRSRIVDWRHDDGVVKLRQKKRDTDREFTYRDVPIHPRLAEAMAGWFARHPGGPFAVCHPDGSRLTWEAATHHLRAALAGSKWSAVRGWHVFRHSFASNLARAGVDQRMIDSWMGHSTTIRLRYQHLRPDDQRGAIGVL